MTLPYQTFTIFLLCLILISNASSDLRAQQDKAPNPKKPHAVIVVGTLHYSPELTMPAFAKELERLGFTTTVVIGEGDPEKKTKEVLPGIEALAKWKSDLGSRHCRAAAPHSHR